MSPDLLRGRRILVVEDATLLQFLAEQMLDSFGCEMVGPASGLPEAIAFATAEALDAALLDINLADDEECYPAADILASRRIPFAFVSAYAPDSVAERHRDRPLLEKPYSDATLRRTIVDLLTPAAAAAP